MPSAGEVVWATVDGDRRPWLVVSRAELARGGYVLAVPCTTARLDERATLRNCVLLEAGEGGIAKRCVAQAELCAAVRVEDLDTERLGVLSAERWRELVRAVGYVLNASCEPEP